MTKKDNQDELIDKLLKLDLINASDDTKDLANMLEKQYKYYASRVIDLKEQLDNTPKIFKKKRAELEQEIKEMQDKSDNYFKKYLTECESLYNLHQELFKDKG